MGSFTLRRTSPLLVLTLVLAAVPAVAQPSPMRREATVHVDKWGVPHIDARDPVDMAYAFGYAQANERLFEMDIIRRIGQGRLSELLGDDAYEGDVAIRQHFYDRDDIDRQLALLPDETLALLQAYADGVNQALVEQIANPAELPAVYAALGDLPRPWSVHDSASVLLLFTMVSFAGEGEGGELENVAKYQALVDRYGEQDAGEVWQDVFPLTDRSAPTVIQNADAPRPPDGLHHPREPHRLQRRLDAASAVQAADALRAQLAAAERALDDLPVPKVGSYAYAVSGDRTRNGGGLLLGTPQAGFTFPSTFHEVGIHTDGWDCQGMTVPGLGPFIGIGWCNDHAWSLVAGNAGDQVDVYVERLDPATPTNDHYVHDGESRPFEERTETFLVKSTTGAQLEQRTETFRYTHHGAVFAEDEANGVAYSLRRAQTGLFVETFVGLHALNTAQGGVPQILDDVLPHLTATYSAVFADRSGNIGYAFTGLQPVRADGFDHRFAMPGTGEAEWQGFIPTDQMPHVLNPKSGVLVVNQGVESKPVSWWPASSWLSIGRVNRLEANRRHLLDQHPSGGWDAEDMVEANRATIERIDPQISFFAPYIDEALADLPPDSDLAPLAALWEAWQADGFPRVDADGDHRFDHPGVAAFSPDRFYDIPAAPLWGELWRLAFGDDLPGGYGWGHYFSRLSLLKHAFDGPHAERRLSRDYLDGPKGGLAARRGALIREALLDSLPALRRRYGPDPASWQVRIPTIDYDVLGIAHPREMVTVDHGTYSMIVDLAAGAGRSILPPGNGVADRAQDEARFQLTGELPDHADDQLELYEQWKFKRMCRDDYHEKTCSPEEEQATGRASPSLR